ncbi:hypothetical protein EXIGLDRAFT_769331 [Exidia glandulosa HHB12029]|uniref:HMG box domain-containing protein n=1 Tax=Exidia glandulosa HHB12029 TaxID=1314781 RepID=A0A165HIY1_EXIGL|nr:hypothetical protein EXIGLDRAFT_769331 [Exidia glandulosa HHB12029]
MLASLMFNFLDAPGAAAAAASGPAVAAPAPVPVGLDDDEQRNVTLMAQTLNADGTPKRPMNAFMIFARKRRPQVSAQNQLLRTGEICKILSREWNSMAIHEKQEYLDLAKRLKDNFNSKYPDYVYRRRPNNSRRKRGRGEHRVGSVGPGGGGDGMHGGGDLDDDDSHVDESDNQDAPGTNHTLQHPTHILPTHTQPYYPLMSHAHNVPNGHSRNPLASSSRQPPPPLYPVANVPPGPHSAVSYTSSSASPLSAHPVHAHYPQSHQGNYFSNDRHWSDNGRPSSSHQDPAPVHFPLRTASPAGSYPLSAHHSSVQSSSASPTSATNSRKGPLQLLSTPFHPQGSDSYSAHAPGEHVPSSAASSHSGSGPASTSHSPSTSTWPRAPQGRPSPPIHSVGTTPSPTAQLYPMAADPASYQQPQRVELPSIHTAVPARTMGPPHDAPMPQSIRLPYDTTYRPPPHYHNQHHNGHGDIYGHAPVPVPLTPSYMSTPGYSTPGAQSSTGPQSAHSASATLSYESPWSSRERLGGQPQRDPHPDHNSF